MCHHITSLSLSLSFIYVHACPLQWGHGTRPCLLPFNFARYKDYEMIREHQQKILNIQIPIYHQKKKN